MKAIPFLVTSLPHSRTAWMSVLLSNGGTLCHYETISGLTRIEDLHKIYDVETHRYVGVSDCALGWFLPWIMENIGPKTLIIERPVAEVNDGMEKLGFARTNYCDLEIERLREFKEHPLVRWVMYKELDNEFTMQRIFSHLIPGEPFDVERYKLLQKMKIETDIDATMETVRLRKKNMDFVLRDVIPLIKPVTSNGAMRQESIK